MTAVSGSIFTPQQRDRERRIPEAPSPRLIATARSISTSASNDYPPGRFEDLKTEQIRSSTAFIQPRQVPIPGQPQGLPQGLPQALPTITNAVIGGQGIGGLPVQGQLFPPIRAYTDPVKPASGQSQQDRSQGNSKRSIFDTFEVAKSPARAVTVGKLAISHPVLKEGGTNPLDKVATTDLATAAQMERERRALMAVQNQTRLVERVNAGVSPERGRQQAATTIRVEVSAPFPVSEPSRPDSETLASIATGAQMSPSGEELRRRSPRQVTPSRPDKESIGPSTSPSMTSRTPSPPLKSAARALPEQENLVVNPIIRPSRQLPPSPEPQTEPVKTPLQRRPTAGLPMNPRAMSVKRPSPPEGLKSRQETVMFVNNIVYDDPNFVESVMEDAKDRGSKHRLPGPINTTLMVNEDTLPQAPEPPGTASSVVHRPRPIPRKTIEESDASFYPQMGHRKSKSAGNVILRKSILQSNPGSPTTLPPLPPPPQPPAKSTRPQPNSTKSMTFDEKVEFMFPPPKSADRAQRRSSVPNLQGSFMKDSPTLTEFDAPRHNNGVRDSKKSVESIETRSIFSEQEREKQREGSTATYQGLILDLEDPTDGIFGTNAGKRASSPVLPAIGDIKSATSVNYDDETATNFGSVYSPLPAQQIGLTVYQARAIKVVRPDKVPENRAISAVTNSEEMTIMLDTSVAREVEQVGRDAEPSSPVDDGSPVEETTSTRSSGPWHRRIGEETLSFSGSSDKRGSKRGPPPTPLNLSDRPTPAKQAVLAQATEPSPLPSPEEALKMIQAQLLKYEQADRGSTESPGQMVLLNDLETEMGQQETRWLGIKNEFSRDSLSTLDMNSPTAESRRTSIAPDMSLDNALTRTSSTRSNAASDRQASRRTRLASYASSRSSTKDGDDVPLGTRATLWQKKLAEAHAEFLEHELDRKRSMNFLSFSSKLGSPTPPDSDDSEIEIESKRNLAALFENQKKAAMPMKGLWTASEAPKDRSGLMWVRPERPYYVPLTEPPLPGLAVRPAQRIEWSMLSIDRGQYLWQRPISDSTFGSSGLWNSSSEPDTAPTREPKPESESRVSKFYKPGLQRSRTLPSPRPLTQRPPRRSKRITALPDILEDPQPLPDKRDTLGIFQFPWGEKSDIPSVPTRPSFMAMPGTMSTGGSKVRAALDARSRQLEESEYSSSFFDDYEEEDEKSDDSSEMGSDSDDGFDETTLFEIANLLKASSSEMPSTDSFFGPSRDSVDSVVDVYGNDDDQSDPTQGSGRQTILVAIEEEVEGLEKMLSPAPLSRSPQSLWETSFTEERGQHGKGLPQPDGWHIHDENVQTVRAKPRVSAQAASIISDSLWTKSPLEMDISRSPMWTPPESPKQGSSESPSPEASLSFEEPSDASTPEEGLPRTVMDSSPLWEVQERPQRGDHGVGLPQPRNWESYDGVKSTARSKPRQSEPAIIESLSLWATVLPELPSPSIKMWTLKTKSAPVTRAASPVNQVIKQAKPASRLLWSAPASPKHLVGSGLFDLTSGRTEFRTTTQSPAAVQMERKSRSPSGKSLERLTSTTLWVVAATVAAEKNWLSLRSSPKKVLWSAPASPREVAESGLFDPTSCRSDFRTTSQKPAAIEITRKTRSPERKPVDQLISTTLWVPNTVPQSERNWISPMSSPGSEAPEIALLPENRKATLQKAIAASLLRVQAVPEELWDEALNEAETASYSIGSAEDVASSQGRDVALQAAIASSLLRVKPVPIQLWQEALVQAIAASYVVHAPTAVRKPPVQATPADWAAALAVAVSKSYSKPFDASKRHPVFAASSLATKASLTHPAATGYTYHVAAVHPVFFGSGIGVVAHPAMPSNTTLPVKVFDASARHPVFAASSLTSPSAIAHPAATGYTSDVAKVHPVFFGSGATKVSQEAVHPALVRQPSKKAGGGRISAMVSMFDSQDSIRSRSGSRDPSLESVTRRAITPPRPATPEPSISNKEAVVLGEESYMDPSLLAQIEALEQERLFAEQWAAGSFEPVSDVPADDKSPLEPSPVLLQATQYVPPTPIRQEQPSLADKLADELVTPTTTTSTASLEPRIRPTTVENTPTAQKQPKSADEIAAELFTPKDITPATPLAPLSMSAGTSEPKTPTTQRPETPKTPKAGGWLSSFTSRFGKSPNSSSPPPSAPEDEAPVPQLKRSDTLKSVASMVSETNSDIVLLRESMHSVDSDRNKKPAGSKIQIIY